MHIDKEKYFRDVAKKNQETLKVIGKDIIAVVSQLSNTFDWSVLFIVMTTQTRQRDIRSRDYYKALVSNINQSLLR